MTWRRQHLFVPWNRPVCLSGGEAQFSRQELLSSHLISHPGETEVRTGRREREKDSWIVPCCAHHIGVQ